jgi:hypothetical protein
MTAISKKRNAPRTYIGSQVMHVHKRMKMIHLTALPLEMDLARSLL